ncbi:uncharacterized protein C19orf18 homolog [Saccopteryx leptura]|uniref:uncharacterized protein C19orf18 homolog n=1 Tax=Saccopteryx leptura TaxID=249018 RepID=UPI00339C48CE
MDKIGSSFTFFFLFLMEWPLLVCLPYAGVMEDVTSEPTNNVTAHWMALNTDTSDAVLIPHRPALMEVIKIACVALSIALVCGTAVFYMIYRRAQAEQKQQLASLYRNIKIPLLGEEEDGFQDEYKDESSDLRSENGEQLAQFINSGRSGAPERWTRRDDGAEKAQESSCPPQRRGCEFLRRRSGYLGQGPDWDRGPPGCLLSRRSRPATPHPQSSMAAAALRRPAEVSASPGPSLPHPSEPGAPVRGPVTSCSPGPGVLDHEALVGDTRGDAVTELTGGGAAV